MFEISFGLNKLLVFCSMIICAVIVLIIFIRFVLLAIKLVNKNNMMYSRTEFIDDNEGLPDCNICPRYKKSCPGVIDEHCRDEESNLKCESCDCDLCEKCSKSSNYENEY